jgi:GNAT superfamily N-acetyltransferase
MTTRKAVLPDIENLSRLFDKYRVFYEKQSDLTSVEHFLTERIRKEESAIFITENSENKLVGFVQLYPIFSSTKLQRLWLLNELFVDECFRGKGISIQLIARSKEFCKETKACGLLLETSKTNEIANNLYLKTGFCLDQEHNFYSWNND